MHEALLFDLDGTLLETDHLHARVFAEIFAEHGRQIDEAFYLDRIQGRQNAGIFAEHFPGADAAALADDKEARFRVLLGDTAAPMPGLTDLLDRARAAGWGLAVVTNAPAENARAMLAAIGLSDAFDTLVLGDDCPAGKPDPAPYAEAMRRLGAAPGRSVAFEDSRAGLASAAAAGARTVGVTSSLPAETLRAAGARHVIRDFTDPALAPALEPLNRRAS